MKYAILTVGCLILALVACKKPITEPNSGIYRGTFYHLLDNGDTSAQGIAHLALSKDGFGGSFQMSGDTVTGAPYSCHGTYVIDNSTQMTFSNDANVDVGFQPHYLLDTTYTYKFDDTNFELWMELGTSRFQYTLIRN